MKFESEKHLARYISYLGGTLWLVGGAVRDELMGREVHDRDYMITGLGADGVDFEKVVGADFPVFLLDIGGTKCEVAMARKERKSGKGHKGFDIYSDPSVTVEEDLSRRDLTINSMAKEILTGEIVDPFGGREDIERKVLRHTSEAFREDPLRVYRVARFAAELDFEVSDATCDLMRLMQGELYNLPGERIWGEVEKVLLSGYPREFFDTLGRINLLRVHFQEINALCVEDKHDGTTYNHTMKLLDKSDGPLMRFGLLVHDFGKGMTDPTLHPSHHGHDKLGRKPINALCERLRIPNKYRDFGLLAASEHMRIKRADEMRCGKFFRWVGRLEEDIESLARLSYIDSVYREGADATEEYDRFKEINVLIKQAIYAKTLVNGEDLLAEGRTPGPAFGETLFQRRVREFMRLRYEGGRVENTLE